jgi:hypothetical protein
MKGRGSPLPASTRAFFEPRFGASFSHVRVHTDTRAARSAGSINAKAFTVGGDIAFAAGQYAPETGDGKQLLAHELTHVVQQKGSAAPDAVARQPDAGPADAGVQDAGGAGETREFRGTTLSTDPAYTYDLLRRMVTVSGWYETRDFVDSFASEVAVRRPAAGISEDPEFNLDSSILSTLNTQFTYITEDRNRFIAYFEQEARAAAKEFLLENRRHVLAEAIRYGVRDLHLDFSFFGGLELVGETDDNASTRGLAIAAQGLIDRKRTADRAMERYKDTTAGIPAIAELGNERSWNDDKAELDAQRAVVHQTQRELDVYRLQIELQFPILADFSSDKDFKWDELEELAKGAKVKHKGATKVIVDQIIDKLGKIYRVQEELEPGGDVNVWLVPEIRDPLREKLSAIPGSFHGKIVDEQIKDEEPSAITGILIALVQLGLVLLAPVTGGLSLIPAAAISVGTAYQHIKEYQLKKAMHGTDFGAAALSAQEPSLFWLAADIIGAGFDVVAAGGAAVRLFGRLARSARALRGAQAAEALETLERDALRLGNANLAKRVTDSALDLQRGAKEIGITADEARKFQQAATEVAEQELRSGFKVAKTAGEGNVKVSRAGGIFVCDSPCTMVRERYKDVLARPEPKYAERLNDLERRARSLSPADDAARQQIANEAAALELEMRATVHKELDLPSLRELASTDPEAAEVLRLRYTKMSDFEIFRLFSEEADETAAAIIRQRFPSNEAALRKILGSEYRPPHSATAIVRRDGKEITRQQLVSGKMTAEERALGFPKNMLATHTEARAVKGLQLRKGDFLEIRGQYNPCKECMKAMREAASNSGARIRYWWQGGSVTFP